MEYLKRRNNVNSLFGTYVIAQNSTEVVFNAGVDDNIYDYILRDPKVKSLNNEIEQVQINFNIKKNPQTYLVNKTSNLEKIAKECKKFFKKKFEFYLNAGYDQETAEKKATEATNHEKDELMKIHKKKYPVEYTSLQPLI